MNPIIWNIETPTNIPSRLSIYKGADTNIYIQVLKKDGNPLNLTGASIWFTLKRTMLDADLQAIFVKKTPTDVVVKDYDMGLIKIIISNSDTVNLPKWNCFYVWTIQLVNSAGVVYYPLNGSVDIYNNVSVTRT